VIGPRSPRRMRANSGTSRERGQSLVEFAVILPALMILLLGLLEFGFVFAHHQGLEYATREGARTASALADGQNGQNGLPVSTACTKIDDQVIAAVQRVITGKGSLVLLDNVTRIRIYKYDDTTSGPAVGFINVWSPSLSGNNVVDGTALKFKQTSGSWDPCTRFNGLVPDAVGVDVSYTYHLTTALGSLLKWAGANTLPMTDATVMVLNP
jgi:Flp pilus assembly protein TadG